MLQSHLSALDAAFLYVETPEMPMHIGGMYLLELPKGHDTDYFEDFKAMIAGRMHLAPLFKRKLALMPFELANPMWIEDDDIDIDYHIRRLALPKPGTIEQLEKFVGRLHSSLLDRSRPLWEFYVIEGLADGRMAFYSKVHHAALDGAAGMKLAATLLDVTEAPRKVKPPPQRPGKRQYQLGVGELLSSGLGNLLGQYVKLAVALPSALKTVGVSLLSRDEDGKIRPPKLPKEFVFGPRTHFNGAITNQRAFASISLPLGEVKALGKLLDSTINDMVMAICSGALRRYLADYGDIPEKPLIAAVPMSTRAQDDQSMNNQVTGAPVSLASDIADPLERLAEIKRSAEAGKALAARIKASQVPLDMPSLGLPWLISGAVALFARSRIANAMPPIANLVISNVPGPQVPLYIARAKVLTMYPVSIPTHTVGLNITVQSYNGNLDFGITACRRAVPDAKALAGHLAEALAELRKVGATIVAEREAAAAADAEAERAEQERKERRRARRAPASSRRAKPVEPPPVPAETPRAARRPRGANGTVPKSRSKPPVERETRTA